MLSCLVFSYLVSYCFGRVKQVIVKVNLNNAAVHYVCVLYTVSSTEAEACTEKTAQIKKFLAVALSLSSSFLLKFLQTFKEKFIFTSVIIFSVLVSCSVLQIIFSITFWSSCIMKLLKLSDRNVSRKSGQALALYPLCSTSGCRFCHRYWCSLW